jgi:amino acid adenylation domain-containing protein
MKSLYTTSPCISELFQEQVERSPDKIALICGHQTLTYRELNTRANQLAHHLQAQGVEPETLIGLYMERSVEIVISILAILKAGGAYVPLDPKYPKDRIAFIATETQISILLTQENLISELPQLNAKLVCIDRDWKDITQESEENLLSETTLDNLSYLIYTSGSTGKPKGVQIPHSNISNYVQAMSQAFQLTSKDTYLHTASFSFSSSVRQLMVPLSQGATVVVAASKQIQTPLILFELIKQHQITIIDLVPSYWRSCTEVLEQLTTEQRNNILDNQLRLIVSASEPLLSDIPKKWRLEFNQDISFINMYGQTETTGIVCVYPIPDEYEDKVTIVPIGRPIANTEVYVLDEKQSPVAIGEIGELYISGSSLARSYFNRPDLTDEKFIPNPFSDEPGSRLYKAGDLGRLLPDGTIKFIGRADYQVKIRGQRVELGEIESIIALYPGVKQTIVMGKEISGDQRLVAYIVPRKVPSKKTDQTVSIKELRNYLKEKLPEYMVPAAFVILPTFPLTPTGKIDRRALPDPENLREQIEASFVAPRNELELKLTKIWEKVLGVQPIGIRDKFFEIGGHSLLAVRLFNEIERTVGKNLPLHTLLQVQTIEEMATVLSQEKSSASWSSLVMIQPGSNKKPPLFLIHGIWGNVLFYRELVRYLEPDQPVYGLQAKGLDGKQAAYTSVEEMAANYIQEIKTIQPKGPYYLGGYSFGGEVVFEMARQLQEQAQETALLVLLDTKAPKTIAETSDVAAVADRTYLREILDDIQNLNLWLKKSLEYWPDKLHWHLTGGKLSIFYRSYLRYIKRAFTDIKLLDIRRVNNKASKSYVGQSYHGNLTLLCCQPPDDNSDLGWGKLVTGEVNITIVPGNHFTIIKEPNVLVLGQQLNLCLQQKHLAEGLISR